MNSTFAVFEILDDARIAWLVGYWGYGATLHVFWGSGVDRMKKGASALPSPGSRQEYADAPFLEHSGSAVACAAARPVPSGVHRSVVRDVLRAGGRFRLLFGDAGGARDAVGGGHGRPVAA